MDEQEKYAVNMMIVFGALIIGALMIVNVVSNDKAGFLFGLGAAILAWFSAFAVLLDKPRVYSGLIALSVILVAASITAYVT